MIKNSLKVLFGNLGLVWKSLLYKLLCLFVSLGIASPLIVPVVVNLVKGGFFANLNNTVNNLVFNVNINSLFSSVKELALNFNQIVSQDNQIALVVISLVLFVLVYYFFNSLLKHAVSGSIMTFMSSYAKTSFIGNYLTNFKRSVQLAFVKMITVLPLSCINIVLTILIVIGLRTNPAGAVLVAIIFYTLFNSIKNTLFVGFENSVYIHNNSIYECFKNNIRIIKNKGIKIFSDNIFITLFSLLFNLMMITFTVCAGLLITIPLFMVFNAAYNSVIYYDYNGMRYYLDSNNIFTPKKLEEKDSFKKIKDII